MKKNSRTIICAGCGLTWNISRDYKNKGDYICPACSKKRKTTVAKKTMAITQALIMAALMLIPTVSVRAEVVEKNPATVTIEGSLPLGGLSMYIEAFYDNADSENEEALLATLSEPEIETSDEEYEILCRITEAEATGGTMEQKENVVSCILNRVESDEWPDTIEGVVFQSSGSYHQFSPIDDGRYYSVPITDSTREAVNNVLESGSRHGCTFFCTPTCRSATSGWFSTLKVEFCDGMHNHYTGRKK